MTEPTDKRLIEYFIPIKQISAEASREKSIRHGHISTLHLWWARRPLVASRAAVFAALVPWDAKPQIVDIDTNQPMTLNKLMIALCKWEVEDKILNEARRLIREQYPDNPPKVLDMFAGGGSIPLEALRLGCEAYALDLNPVAHIIELATLVYPQKYGAQLAEDVRKWGQWVLERVRAEVGDLYPLIPDPEYRPGDPDSDERHSQPALFKSSSPLEGEGENDDLDDEESSALHGVEGDAGGEVPPGFLQPVAYLWTRTVTCPNPACRATVPLVRQTWLKKKKGDNVALEMTPHPTENRMMFTVRRAADPNGFDFDPAGFSQRGNSVCYRCGTTVTSDYVKTEGKAGRMYAQMMATVCVRPGARGKIYLSPDEHELPVPDDDAIRARIEALTAETGITPPEERIAAEDNQHFQAPMYGMLTFGDLFTTRQMLTLLTFVKGVRAAHDGLTAAGTDPEYAKAVVTYLGIVLDKMAVRHNVLVTWAITSPGGRLTPAYGRQALPMVWDYTEANFYSSAAGGFMISVEDTLKNVIALSKLPSGFSTVTRGSAESLSYSDGEFTAVVTDPPYYDYISYADLSDFFYVWLKRSIGARYPEHFGSELTPKRSEAIVSSYRHETVDRSREIYEERMSRSFAEANRVLKEGAPMVVVYAHKTTAGWATLVEALRNAGFEVVNAWPIDTEMTGHLKKNTAALASSLFLAARKRHGSFGRQTVAKVLEDMRKIVRREVGILLAQGITGADLNIAAVGAGLAPFTRYARVELPNGEELSAAAYLEAVQAEVVRVLLGEAAQTDPVTQYYIMGRSYYGEAQVEFDEANTLARATGVELDTGPAALTTGSAALVDKKGSKVRLRDYAERGDSESLGLPGADGRPAPLIDVLHRLLWLIENESRKTQDFINLAQLNPAQKYLLRLTAQALSGRALAGEPLPGMVRDERTGEQRAIDTLLAAWRRVVDEGAML